MKIVSLVPSVTETLLAWNIEPVACTRFCEQPSLRHVGGTKDPDIAAIVALKPDLIVVPTCGRMLDAVRRVTRAIPILVTACTDDMVASGIVASLARPGGNITGRSTITAELAARSLAEASGGVATSDAEFLRKDRALRRARALRRMAR